MYTSSFSKKKKTMPILKTLLYADYLRPNEQINMVVCLVYCYLFNLQLIGNKKLPSIRKIANFLHIAEITIRKALNILFEKSYMYEENGKYYLNQLDSSYIYTTSKIDDSLLKNFILGSIPFHDRKNYSYVRIPMEVLTSKDISFNAKYYYCVFLDFFMKSPDKQYYKYCHVSKLARDKGLSETTLYRYMKRLKQAKLLYYETATIEGSETNKGYIDMHFFSNPSEYDRFVKKKENNVATEEVVSNQSLNDGNKYPQPTKQDIDFLLTQV